MEQGSGELAATAPHHCLHYPGGPPNLRKRNSRGLLPTTRSIYNCKTVVKADDSRCVPTHSRVDSTAPPQPRLVAHSDTQSPSWPDRRIRMRCERPVQASTCCPTSSPQTFRRGTKYALADRGAMISKRPTMRRIPALIHSFWSLVYATAVLPPQRFRRGFSGHCTSVSELRTCHLRQHICSTFGSAPCAASVSR